MVVQQLHSGCNDTCSLLGPTAVYMCTILLLGPCDLSHCVVEHRRLPEVSMAALVAECMKPCLKDNFVVYELREPTAVVFLRLYKPSQR